MSWKLGSVGLNEHNLEQLKWRIEETLKENGDALESVGAWLDSHSDAGTKVRDEMLAALGLKRRLTPQGGVIIERTSE